MCLLASSVTLPSLATTCGRWPAHCWGACDPQRACLGRRRWRTCPRIQTALKGLIGSFLSPTFFCTVALVTVEVVARAVFPFVCLALCNVSIALLFPAFTPDFAASSSYISIFVLIMSNTVQLTSLLYHGITAHCFCYTPSAYSFLATLHFSAAL